MERITLQMVNGARPTILGGQVWKLKVSMIPSSMVGVEMISVALEPTNGFGNFISSWGANGISGSNLVGTREKIVAEPWPLEMLAGANTTLNAAIKIQLAASGSCVIDFPPGESRLVRVS
jgi:hypothetical protein